MSDHEEKHDGEEGHGEEHEGGHGGHGGAHGGGGHEEHAGAPEWLISFADNVALLMGFFVILLAMNMKEKTAGGIGGKDQNGSSVASDDAMLDFVLGMRQAFNNPVSISSPDPRDGPLVKRLKQRSSEGTTNTEGTRGKNPEQQAIRPTDYNRVTASVSFEQNSSAVSADARPVLVDAARRLRGQRFIVEVRGHASAVEAATGPDAAMRIGFARALSAAAVLAESGLQWAQLRVVSCADNDRHTQLAGDAAGHRSNQRVEIVVTDDTVAKDPHTQEQK